MSRGITSTVGLVRKVFDKPPAANERAYFRGHSKREYRLQPSLFRRKEYRAKEHVMFRELLVSNPADFAEDATALDMLVRMQHYSLPTRLLDLTSNPLMALYFACKSNHGTNGEVITFFVDVNRIKFFDSDTASIIANLARLDYDMAQQIDAALSREPFNESAPVQRLLHFIRQEKPYFQPVIDPPDVKKILCVRTKMSNARIVSQAGAFLLFGLEAQLGPGDEQGIRVDKVIIDGGSKRTILSELDSLNINESTVFPHIEKSAQYIAGRYGE